MKFDMLERTDLHDDLRRLALYCQGLTAGRVLPVWRDFRPEDVPWMLGRMCVIEVLEAGADFRFRLSGMLMQEIYGTDLENKRVSEIPNLPMRKALLDNYRVIAAGREAVFHRALLRWKPDYDIHVQRLLVPFADAEGEGVHTILCGVVSDVPDEMLILYRDNKPPVFRIFD